MNTLEPIRKARIRVEEAESVLFEVVHRVLRPGTAIQWRHGDNRRSGVVHYHGFAGRNDLRVRVRSGTGKMYWVRVAQIFGCA